ncbi:MAG TPA: ROK family protein, partial [Caulobacteraceae bacterium]|nr:ROK family protein [Caulobacteraceae bacterium]
MSDALLVFDLGGTNLRAGAFAPKTGQLLNTARTSSDEVRGVADGAAALEAVLADLGGQVLNRQPAAVGMAVPGPVQDGVASRLPSLFGPAYKGGLDFEALGRRLWDRPTFACNDLTAAGHGLVAAGHRDFGVLTLGSGVGGKLFVGGRPLLGRAGFGGEIGHWRVPGAPPVACDCGGSGHLSALASGRGIVRLARWRAERDPKGFKASALAV